MPGEGIRRHSVVKDYQCESSAQGCLRKLAIHEVGAFAILVMLRITMKPGKAMTIKLADLKIAIDHCYGSVGRSGAKQRDLISLA